MCEPGLVVVKLRGGGDVLCFMFACFIVPDFRCTL